MTYFCVLQQFFKCISLVVDDTPSLGKLSFLRTAQGKNVKVIQTVAPKWQNLGDMMEFDADGMKLDEISKKFCGDDEKCCRAVFQKWIKGDGIRPCSWRKLIELLENCKFEELASDLQSVFEAV